MITGFILAIVGLVYICWLLVREIRDQQRVINNYKEVVSHFLETTIKNEMEEIKELNKKEKE